MNAVLTFFLLVFFCFFHLKDPGTVPAPTQTGMVIDHPLAPDIGNHAVNVPNSVILHDTENNPLTDAVIPEAKTMAQIHGGCLSLSDHDRLRIFVHEFVIRGLIPWVERMLRTLNEQVCLCFLCSCFSADVLCFRDTYRYYIHNCLFCLISIPPHTHGCVFAHSYTCNNSFYLLVSFRYFIHIKIYVFHSK